MRPDPSPPTPILPMAQDAGQSGPTSLSAAAIGLGGLMGVLLLAAAALAIVRCRRRPTRVLPPAKPTQPSVEDGTTATACSDKAAQDSARDSKARRSSLPPVLRAWSSSYLSLKRDAPEEQPGAEATPVDQIYAT